MSTASKLVAFAATIGLAFGAAALAGAAIDPTDADETSMSEGHGDRAHGGHSEAGPAHAAHGAANGAAREPAASGLAVSGGGYTLRPSETLLRAGKPQRFEFEIVDRAGRAVREGYEPTHERELHLIAVRRDTATFEHVHPQRAADGTWSTPLTFPEAGTYRVFADFQIGGKTRTLATDVFVAGDFAPQPLPAPAGSAAADSYDVELRGEENLRAGSERELTFAVSRDGRPVEGLEDYLGAKGHLVALREGDLAYLHVHPLEGGSHSRGGERSESHANEVPFAATFPTAGRYRLFLQFKDGGRARTVDYTVEVPR